MKKISQTINQFGIDSRLLTDADGDVGRPLVVVLTGYCFLSNELKSKLALKAQHVTIQETISISHSIQRGAWVPTALLVDFYRERMQPLVINKQHIPSLHCCSLLNKQLFFL